MQSKIAQFKGLFGFGQKPAVEQPTPASSLTPPNLENTTPPIAQSPELTTPQSTVPSMVSSATPPVAESNSAVAESAPNLIDAVLANLGTKPSGENVPANNDQPLPEVTAPPQPEQTQPEQTPAEKLKEQIADSIDAFLEEVVK